MDILKTIEDRKLVPVVALDDASDALPLAEALLRGGLPVAEITFRTAAAEDSIRRMTEAFPELLVGAGTVTDVSQARAAVKAGARFLVTPGFSREVTEFALERNMPIFPGVCTPTEVMMTLPYHLPVLKFFPAEQVGGLKMIEALRGPFPQLRFLPTGGINPQNVKDYLASPAVAACGGSWMVRPALIRAGRFNEIERLVREAAALAAG